jgi:hypothetical protein
LLRNKKKFNRLSIPELSKLVPREKNLNGLSPPSESRSFTYAKINILFARQHHAIIFDLKIVGGVTAD